MNVQINGDKHDIPEQTSVLELLTRLNLDPQAVVVEVDGRIVTCKTAGSEQIPTDAKVEIVHFVGGG